MFCQRDQISRPQATSQAPATSHFQRLPAAAIARSNRVHPSHFPTAGLVAGSHPAKPAADKDPPIIRRLHPGSELVGQIVRFGATGGLLTLLVAGGYWALAEFAGVEPMLSLTLSFLAATGIGYLLHSRWSFRGHGASGSAAARTARFFAVNTLGFLANQFFVWLLVKQMGGPTWWPVLPIILVTPVLTFSLNRQWVFR